MSYVHYGSEHFNKDIFKSVKNSGLNKPARGTGLWASPVLEDGTSPWLNWCENENFYTGDYSKWFKFGISNDAKVLYLSNQGDLDNFFKDGTYQIETSFRIRSCDLYPDFEKLANDYDAMFVKIFFTDSEFHTDKGSYWQLYGWDADSLLVFNPDIIIEMESSDK